MTKFEKVKNWIEENKAEIAYYACTGAMVVGGGLLIGKVVKNVLDARKIVDMPVPENWGHGKVEGLHSDPTGVVAFITNIPTNDVSTLGESLAKIPVPEKFKYTNILMTCVEEEIEKI